MPLVALQAALSLGLALTFLASAIPKLRHPKGFILVVLEYRVLPPSLGRLYARLLPGLELLVALLLLSGTLVRLAAAAASALFVSFVVGVGVNMVRGRDLDCGCFGKGRRTGVGLLLQDSALLAASLALAALAGGWVRFAPWSPLDLVSSEQAPIAMAAGGCVLATGVMAHVLGWSSERRRHARLSALYAGRGTSETK